MDAKNKAEVRARLFQIIPLMGVAGAGVYALRYVVQHYLRIHVPGFGYALLATVLFSLINKRYLKRAREKAAASPD